jgi:hypothetical protein
MNEWKCTVRTPSNWIQTVRVEAYTHSDAVAFAESMTGGKCIMAVVDNSYNSSDNNSPSSSGDMTEINPVGLLVIAAIVFLVAAWKYILIIGGIALLIWFIIKYSQE